MTTPTSVQPEQLPVAVTDYLAAHDARDTAAALRTFTPGARVVDEGRTYRGTEEVRGFLGKAGAQFSYTTTLVSAQRSDETRWRVTNRLEGDFPGGVVDLGFSFAMEGDLIDELVIAP